MRPISCAAILAATLVTALTAITLPAAADGETAGEFDYYVLSLSWSPNWCASEGDTRNSPQCDARHEFSFTLHGLWPQYDDGWPSFCRTSAHDPSSGETDAMADIMGTGGLAWHQWKKHGRCAGASSADYFATARRAYESIAIPQVFRDLNRDVTIPARVVEEAFIEANPGLTADQITITCKDAAIQEVRICLTRDLDPRPCGTDVARDCTLDDALMEAVR